MVRPPSVRGVDSGAPVGEGRAVPLLTHALRRRSVRPIRLLAATALAVFAIAAVAPAQPGPYPIGGSVSVPGGTKKNPKPGGLPFPFSVAPEGAGTQPPPVQTYSIAFEGG